MSASTTNSFGPAGASSPGPALSARGRLLMLTTAFLGWLCAGILMSITSVAVQPAVVDLLGRTGDLDGEAYLALSERSKPNADAKSPGRPELGVSERTQLTQWNVQIGQWVAWMKCAFLLGAACGGLVFGAVGDRHGRVKGMGLSILTYSALAGAAYFADRPVVLLVCWFLACTGVGGMWPNGVALVSEAWSSLSRPLSAGLIGASANIGIFSMSSLMAAHPADATNWRWVMLVAAAPAALGVFSLVAVPESPLWLAKRGQRGTKSGKAMGTGEIFRPPCLWITLTGIGLATVPIVGGWGSADWMVQWADRAGATNPSLKAEVSQARAVTGIVGSFLGGWIASVVGRKRTYFLTSLATLFVAQYTFWRVLPTDDGFLWWVSALGLFSGIYFGWLPLCLPEFFPTRARSAGAGVSFNFGRILTAVTVFTTGAMMRLVEGDYARIGRATSLIFALGMVIVCLAPETSQKKLAD